MVRSDDIVWFQDAGCGRVINFYEVGDQMFVHVRLFANVRGEPSLLDENQQKPTFADARSIVDACTWYRPSPGVIKIVIPPIAILSAV